jgi:hypothetical protein
MTQPFGFTVQRTDHLYGEPVVDGTLTKYPHPEGLWRVSLPHQCDEWVISAGRAYADGVSHTEAVAELERFIAEAQEALAALRKEREVTEP